MKNSNKVLIAIIISAIFSIIFFTIRAFVPVLKMAYLPLGIVSLVVFSISFLMWTGMLFSEMWDN